MAQQMGLNMGMGFGAGMGFVMQMGLNLGLQPFMLPQNFTTPHTGNIAYGQPVFPNEQCHDPVTSNFMDIDDEIPLISRATGRYGFRVNDNPFETDITRGPEGN